MSACPACGREGGRMFCPVCHVERAGQNKLPPSRQMIEEAAARYLAAHPGVLAPPPRSILHSRR